MIKIITILLLSLYPALASSVLDWDIKKCDQTYKVANSRYYYAFRRHKRLPSGLRKTHLVSQKTYVASTSSAFKFTIHFNSSGSVESIVIPRQGGGTKLDQLKTIYMYFFRTGSIRATNEKNKCAVTGHAGGKLVDVAYIKYDGSNYTITKAE